MITKNGENEACIAMESKGLQHYTITPEELEGAMEYFVGRCAKAITHEDLKKSLDKAVQSYRL